MFKKIALLIIPFIVFGCAELQQVVEQLPDTTVSNSDIAAGLRQALDQGIGRFYSSPTKVIQKINLPDYSTLFVFKSFFDIIGT